MEQNQARNLRVGIFLVLSVSLGCLAIIMLGGKASFFEDRYKLHTSFEDVAGLREGAARRLATAGARRRGRARAREHHRTIFVLVISLNPVADARPEHRRAIYRAFRSKPWRPSRHRRALAALTTAHFRP